MAGYLNGYLDVLPQSQRQKIQDVLGANKDLYGIGTGSEEDFKSIMSQLVEEHAQLTKYIAQEEKLDDKSHNEFFSKVYADLNFMFLETNLIESTNGSYDRLYQGILGDLSSEIKSLRERINSLRLVAEGEDGLIVKAFTFDSAADMETDRERFGHLFKDRDGSDTQDTIIQRVADDSRLILGKIMGHDWVRDENGKPVAELKIIDRRGESIQQTKYPIANAIDDSTDTYWGEVILTSEPLNIALDAYPAGGAYTKFTVVLPQPQLVSEIILTPFTTYPMELLSVLYEEDTDAYHVPKELIASSKTYASTSSIVVQFPNILAKRFTFVMRQKNYTKNTYLVREKEVAKADLWEKISKREMEVTLDLTDGLESVETVNLETWTGWDIYMTEYHKYQGEYAKYMEKVKLYREQYAKYVEDLGSFNRRWGVSYKASAKAVSDDLPETV